MRFHFLESNISTEKTKSEKKSNLPRTPVSIPKPTPAPKVITPAKTRGSLYEINLQGVSSL